MSQLDDFTKGLIRDTVSTLRTCVASNDALAKCPFPYQSRFAYRLIVRQMIYRSTDHIYVVIDEYMIVYANHSTWIRSLVAYATLESPDLDIVTKVSVPERKCTFACILFCD